MLSLKRTARTGAILNNSDSHQNDTDNNRTLKSSSLRTHSRQNLAPREDGGRTNKQKRRPGKPGLLRIADDRSGKIL